MAMIHIVSDGTEQGTHVFDESGNELRGVSQIEFNMVAGDVIGSAKLTFVTASLDIIAKVE